MPFPTSPTNGQTYAAPSGITYTYDSTAGAWNIRATGSLTASTTAPTGVSVGHMWYDTANGDLYFRVNDGTNDIWLNPVTPAVTNSTTHFTSSTSAPTGKAAGHFWWDSTNERLFISIDGTRWVDVSS